MTTLKYSACIIIILATLFTSCKKKELAPEEPKPLVEEPDFTLEAGDVNYPLGTTWVYRINTRTETVYATQPNSFVQNSVDTYTVIAFYDSLMPNNVTGKVLQYFFSNNTAAAKELQYVDPVTNHWHSVIFGAGIITSGSTVQLPLNTSSKWKNPYYPAMSSIDSCRAISYKNLETEVGYLKCIYYKALNINNHFLYHKKMGRVYIETLRQHAPDFQTVVFQTIQTTLIKFY